MVKKELEVEFSGQAKLLLSKLGMSEDDFFKWFVAKPVVIGGASIVEFLEMSENG